MSNKAKKTYGEIFETLGDSFIQGFFNLLGKFGLAGILIMILTWFLSVNASDAQKKEIIDTWILQKKEGPNHFLIITIITTFMVVIVGQWYYFVNRLQIQKEEVIRLAAEKNIFQNLAKRKKARTQKKKGKK